MNSRASLSDGGITIGVIGPPDLVEQILRFGAEESFADCNLLGAAQTGEQETHERLRRIESKIDVALFTGPLLYDLARESAALTVPATYVPTSSTSLGFGLLRALVSGAHDLSRVSIDTLTPMQVEEAYAEIGISTDLVHVLEYTDPRSASEFFSFHENLYRTKEAGLAITAIRSVAQKLKAAGIPSVRMTPSGAILRSALRSAALLGMGIKVQGAQIATIVVEVYGANSQGYSGPSNYSQQELSLSLHRVLLSEARHMGATVIPHGENRYLIHATLGSVEQATMQLKVAPFLDRVRNELGLTVGVGIGLGRTARDAEAQAMLALQGAQAVGGTAAFLADDTGDLLSLPPRAHQKDESTAAPLGEAKSLSTLKLLTESLATGSGLLVVDAEQVAEVLDVTARSARRVLQGLVADGLAWTMPAARSAQAGRPRQQFRLITEKLNAGAAS
jgi:hypothetical protein